MIKIMVVACLVGYIHALPFGSHDRPKDDQVQETVYYVVEKNIQPAKGSSNYNKHAQETTLVKETKKSEDVNKKDDNLFDRLIHHKNEHQVEESGNDSNKLIESNKKLVHFSGKNDIKDVPVQPIKDEHEPVGHKKHENILEKIAHKTVDVIKHTGETIHDGSVKLGNITQEAVKKTGEAVYVGSVKIVEKTEEAVKRTGKTVYDGSVKIVDKTEEAIGKTGKAVHDGSVKFVQETGKAVNKAGEEIKITAIHVVEKGEKIIKGEEPLADLNVDTKIKVLNNEVKVQGEIRIGFGHQTGAHGSASANVLGQTGHINADILNSPALDTSTERQIK